VALQDHKFLFSGAGSAGLGIAELVAVAISKDTGIPIESTRQQMYFLDSRGLIYKDRPTGGISTEKSRFAHPKPEGDFDTKDMNAVINAVKPSALIGVSAQGGSFTEACIRSMGAINQRPIIFPLSNPTSKAECTATEAYTHTEGRAIFASGSPFAPVEINGRTLVPGQGNNSYIFPGLALGVMVSRTRRIPDSLFITAAKALSGLVSDEDRKSGNLYPDLSLIGEASITIAVAVASQAFELGLANIPKPDDIEASVRAFQYKATSYE
jgi:malate dehydrogenase (oxaloacetate-decarboxylating)(NADP+)